MGRLAIAAFALAAVRLDPTQPANAPELTYTVLSAYVAFAMGVILMLRCRAAWASHLALVSHVVDLSVFSLLMFLTEGPTSPFFLLFTFSLLSATFRWRWEGALWTAVSILVLLFIAAGVYREIAPGLPIETDRFIIRCAHVLVIGTMLVYFGFSQQRLADETTRLAAWQPDPISSPDSQPFLAVCLAHVANVFAAQRALLVLQDPDEPWATVSVWDKGAFHQEWLLSEAFKTMVAEPLAISGFLRHADGEVLVMTQTGQLSRWQGPHIDPALADRFSMDQILSVPVRSEGATGRLFVTDMPAFSPEDLTIAGVLATQIGVGLDRKQAVAALQRSAAGEERLSLARDLHDGVLQALAGTALQLEKIAQLADRDPGSVRSRIDTLQNRLLLEQQEMRKFIRSLRPGRSEENSRSAEMSSSLQMLAENLEHQWGVAIHVSAESADLTFPAHLMFHLHQIVREAVANAVRHGGASQVKVGVGNGDGLLRVEIADNGGGLSCHGRFDHQQCAELHIGPRSLLERVVGLGGSLVVESSPGGVALWIDLPMCDPGPRR